MAYNKIGKHIHLIDNRNTDLTVDKLVGLTVDKRFIPSVANIIGTDLSKYKVIRKNQFACSLMQVSRDGKMPVAMFTEDEAIMSPAYPMFEVNDDNELMPEYLMMYLSRSEFDREAVFYAIGGVRGSLEWVDFLNIPIPVPSIEEQRRIVAEYQTIERRIKNNEALIQKLEETAQAIYHHTFVEGIDENNLPEGWRMGCLGEIVTFKVGGDKPRVFSYLQNDVCKFPIYSNGEDDKGLYGYTNKAAVEEPSVTISARGNVGTCFLRRSPYSGIVRLVSVIPNSPQMLYYLFYVLALRKMQGDGSAQAQITVPQLQNETIIIPSDDLLNKYYKEADTIYNNIDCIERELTHLRKLQSLLTSKLA